MLSRWTQCQKQVRRDIQQRKERQSTWWSWSQDVVDDHQRRSHGVESLVSVRFSFHGIMVKGKGHQSVSDMRLDYFKMRTITRMKCRNITQKYSKTNTMIDARRILKMKFVFKVENRTSNKNYI